jgi:hypothetical protein
MKAKSPELAGGLKLAANSARFVSSFLQMRNWLSLRFRDAPLGTIGLLLTVLGVMLFPLAASFGGIAPSLRRRVLSVSSVLFLLFPPAILSAMYSLRNQSFTGVCSASFCRTSGGRRVRSVACMFTIECRLHLRVCAAL